MQLHHHQQQLAAHDAALLLVSFTGGYWAEAWQSQMQVPYPLLVDSTRAVYRAYGLRANLLGGVGLKITAYYLRRFFQTGKLPRVWGDPAQLGGDFIVDRSGIIRYIHRSVDATDRPSVETLLAQLAAL